MTDTAPTTPPAAAEAAPTALPGERRIDYVPLESLTGDPRNPKSHDLATIDASYSRFGVVDLITVDGRTGYIISGHGRTATLKDAFARGEEAPEGVKVAEDGTWLVPVNSGWASKNDAEAAAALIAMNRVTEMGGWVDESLLALLQEISDAGADFTGVGFSDADFEDLKSYLDTEHMTETFDPNAEQEDSGDELGSIELFVDQVVVNVVLKEADRPKLYALLQDRDWVVDIRNSNGR